MHSEDETLCFVKFNNDSVVNIITEFSAFFVFFLEFCSPFFAAAEMSIVQKLSSFQALLSIYCQAFLWLSQIFYTHIKKTVARINRLGRRHFVADISKDFFAEN